MATAAVTPDNQTVDVNTTAPDPVAALGSEDTSLLQPPMQPQMPSSTVVNPGSSDGLDAQQQAHHGMLYNLLNEVGTALGGKNSYTIERGDDGKMNITPHESSMPDKWKRIAVAAIRGGLASAANGGTGPGNLSRAVGAGGQAGYQGANSDRQGQIDQANDDFNKKQQTTLFNANMALSQQRLHEATFGNMRDRVQFDQAQADRANGIAATMQNLPTKPVDLGVHKDVMDVASATAANPELMKAHTDGRIYSEPEYDENHQPIGMHSWLIDKDAGERMNPTPVTQRYWGVDDKGQGVIKTRTIPANSMKMKDIMLSSQQGELGIATGAAAAHKQKQEDKKEASEAGLRTAEASKDYAEGAKANAETGGIVSGAADADEAQAQQIAHGEVKPLNQSRSNPHNKAVMQRVYQINPQYSDSLYTATQDLRSQKPNSMGANVGRLGTAILHGDEALKGSTALGVSPSLLTGVKTGASAAYRESAEFLTGEVGQYVDGGKLTVSQGEDIKRDLFATLPSVRNAAIHQVIKLSGGKLQSQMESFKNATRNEFPTERVFNDQGIHDALTRHGIIGQPPAQQAAPQPGGTRTPPAGATAEVHDQSGKLIGYAVNGQYQPLQ